MLPRLRSIVIFILLMLVALTSFVYNAQLADSATLLFLTPTPAAKIQSEDLPDSTSNNPTFEQVVNLGVPVGNGAGPRRLTFDQTTGLLYILSEGLPVLGQGNGLSVYDSVKGTFIDHFKVGRAQHTPLDLQFDPAIGFLYALSGGAFDGDPPSNLVVIDANALQALQEVSDVDAFTAAKGRLYIANLKQLTKYGLKGLGLSQDFQVNLAQIAEVSQLALNLPANRLYLARLDSNGWGGRYFRGRQPDLGR